MKTKKHGTHARPDTPFKSLPGLARNATPLTTFLACRRMWGDHLHMLSMLSGDQNDVHTTTSTIHNKSNKLHHLLKIGIIICIYIYIF